MGIPAERIAFIGDYIIVLPAIQQVGFSVAVADAVEEIREAADLVTRAAGGQGADQEVICYLAEAALRPEVSAIPLDITLTGSPVPSHNLFGQHALTVGAWIGNRSSAYG